MPSYECLSRLPLGEIPWRKEKSVAENLGGICVRRGNDWGQRETVRERGGAKGRMKK